MEKRPFAKRYYSRIFTYLVLGTSYVVLGLILFRAELVALLGTGTYGDSVHVLPYLCIAQGLWTIQTPFNVGLVLKRKTHYIAIVFVGTAIVNVIANSILVPRYGQIGAGMASIVTFSVLGAMCYFAARRFYVVEYEWARCLKIASVVVVVGILSLYIPRSTWLLAGVAKLILLVAVLPILFALGFLHVDEREMIVKASRNAKAFLRMMLSSK
jgi:O-antigen/teichoic acid export membrane protein